MDAKEYLLKITYLDSKIESNKESVKRYKESAENKISNLTPNKVQTSTSKEKMADAVCNYSDLERIIKVDEEKKQKIIDTIGQLSPHESTVLHKCYVDNKTLPEIANELSRSYSWVSKKHSSGIRNIQNILDSREKAVV